jgi:uroporphyrinogen decarboxylase
LIQLLQVFDSWAGELSPHDFAEFSLPSLQYIATEVHQGLKAQGLPVVPLTLFPKGANSSLKMIAQTSGYDVIGLDWCVEPSVARAAVGPVIALQGNLDPNVLYGGKEAIEREVKRMCKSFKGDEETKRWIANLGHGITPGVDPEDLRFFFECVHKYSAN